MKNKIILTILSAVIMAALLLFFVHEFDHDHSSHEHISHDHGSEHDHSHSGSFGEGMAVTDACEETGIVISDIGLKTIGVTTSKPEKTAGEEYIFLVPARAIVYYEDKACIFYFQNGRFNMADVEISGYAAGKVSVKISGVKGNFDVVSEGADLMRLAYIEAFGASGHGHIH